MDWNMVLIEPARLILDKAALYAGKALGVLVILIIGWLIAKAVQNVVTRFLKIAQLDVAADKTGITKILAKGEIKYTLAELLGVLVYWLVILIVVVAAINALDLTVAAQLLNQIVTYVPNVIAAIFVLTAGMFIALVVSRVVNTAAVNAGIAQARILAKTSETVILIVVIVMALEQLKIATTIINLIIPIILGAIGLALALAFGLGGKDAASKIIKETLEDLK
jgi:hypothetical protein